MWVCKSKQNDREQKSVSKINFFFQNFEYAESDIPPLFQKNVSSYYF